MTRAQALATWLKIAALALALAIVAPLAALGRRPRASVLLVGAAALLGAASLTTCGHGPRIGTFNIRQFGDEPTDMGKLTSLVRSLDVDVLAVQEIKSEARFGELARSISSGGRSYRTALSRCGGKSGMRVGFLYDERRVKLLRTTEYPELAPDGGGGCASGDRPGLVGVFQDGSRTLHILTIHFTTGADKSAIAARRAQWQRAYKIVADRRAEGAKDVIILGDANSTGYRDDAQGERTFVDERARQAGMRVESSDLACTEYFKSEGGLTPSLLDHAVATPGLAARGSARVHGYCATLRCEPYRSPTPPDDFEKVSDHCPVTVDLAR